MNVLSLERIAAVARDPARRTAPIAAGGPDLARPFICEEQTHLYWTPLYGSLTREQRIRYNQLFALRVNEYIMMLERDIVDPVLTHLRRHGAVRASPALRAALDGMLDEEERHYEAFAALNTRYLPHAYRDGDRHFMRLKRYERIALAGIQASARWLPFALWIIIAMEEASIGMAVSMIRGADGGALGPLDTHFLALHREHAKDEARHIHIDVHLVRACLATAPAAWRTMNARIFMAFMRDMTQPKANGTSARVVRELVAEYPDLEPGLDALIASLVALKGNDEFQRSLFNRKLTPLAFGLYDEEPALATLGCVLKGYERPPYR